MSDVVETKEGPVMLPTVPVFALQEAASQYRAQLDRVTQAQQALEEQREQLAQTYHTLNGAIAAIELLIPKE